jgi:hypothetical protein
MPYPGPCCRHLDWAMGVPIRCRPCSCPSPGDALGDPAWLVRPVFLGSLRFLRVDALEHDREIAESRWTAISTVEPDLVRSPVFISLGLHQSQIKCSRCHPGTKNVSCLTLWWSLSCLGIRGNSLQENRMEFTLIRIKIYVNLICFRSRARNARPFWTSLDWVLRPTTRPVSKVAPGNRSPDPLA